MSTTPISISMSTTPIPVTPTTPAPTEQHHFNLTLFLRTLLALAPAIAAPFIKNPQTSAIVSQEGEVIGILAQGLGNNQQ